MKENNENWEKQLNTLIIEVAGLDSLFTSEKTSYLSLLGKLEGLLVKKEEVPFDLYRKTIFESISLLQEMKIHE